MKLYQFVLTLSMCLSWQQVFSQQIPFQFALTDTAGIELPNRTISVRTTFTTDTLSFQPEYQETQSVKTNQFGIASLWLGEGLYTLNSSYLAISTSWVNPESTYYLIVEVDSTNSGYQSLATLRYRFPMITVKAKNADSSSFALNASISDSAVYSRFSDTTIYAVASDSAAYALYADSTNYADLASNSIYSLNSDSAVYSRFSDTTIYAVASDSAKYSDTSGYAVSINSGAFADSSSLNEIQSIEQVLGVDSNANGRQLINLGALTIGNSADSTTITLSPIGSAAIAINRTDAGLLLSRLTKSQRDVIVNPEQGLMVYCTDCETDGRVSVFDGNTWELISQTNSTGSYAVISAGAIQNITVSGATFNSTVSDSGGTSVFAKGFCIGSQPYPDLGDTVISPSLLDSAGIFKGRAEYLDRNSKYYLRAYATNAAGTVYGPQQEFLTEGLLSVGDTFGGGIVGYVLQPGDNGYDPGEQHGIIVAQQDYGGDVDWGSCSSIVFSNGATGGTYKNGRTSELLYDAYFNDSVWNTICADSLDQYQNYYTSVMHVVRDINWEGYTDWTVGTLGDYQGIFENVELLNSRITQTIQGSHWTSSSISTSSSTGYRYYFYFWNRPSTNGLTGITTYEWNFVYDDKSFSHDFGVRPIRYF